MESLLTSTESMLNPSDSILISTKKLLGITDEYTHFDTDLIIHINSALSVLTQLGVGPSEGYMIVDKNDKWEDFIADHKKIEMVKSYVYLKVKLIFDPPQSSSVAEAYKNQISEFEWRLNVAVDPGETTS